MNLKFLLRKFLCIFCLSFLTSYIQADPFPVTSDQQTLVVILDWFLNPNHAPLWVAQKEGFFQQQGLKLQFVTPADPNDPPKLIAVDKADIAIDYEPQFLLQVDQGLPLIRIGALINSPLNCLAVLKSSAIHSISDLKGKRIGYSTDTLGDVFLTELLTKNGLTTADVQLINIHYNLVQSLLTQRVDAISGVMRNFELVEMDLAHQPARAFYPEQNGIPPYEELILITNRTHLKDARIPKFLTALEQGIAYYKRHPEQTWQLFAQAHPELNNPLNHQAWLNTQNYFPNHPAEINAQQYQAFIKFLKDRNLIHQDIDLKNILYSK